MTTPTYLTVALLQLAPADDPLETGMAACRQARALGADIALFPEMWNCGYDLDRLEQGAIAPTDEFITRFRALAHELKMAIALTYKEQWDPAPRNTMSLIDRHGQIVLTYAKVHTCEWGAEGRLTSGDGFRVAALDTAAGQVKVGAMICFDREFPESARVLMLQGAEIILVPNACDLEINRLSQFRARAYENMVGLAMTNYAAPHCNGHSIAFDGIAFARDESPRDMLLVEAGQAAGVYLARFDLAALRDYRRHEVWGNAYRKPRHYGALVAEDVAEPFKREDARR